MFVYEGRLDWKPYGDNETFVIVLPDGPVRVGDTVYLFYQWTFNASNVKKDNSFNKVAIDKVSKTPGGDDTFIAKFNYKSYYDIDCSWNKKTEKLSVKVKSPGAPQDLGDFALSALIDRHSQYGQSSPVSFTKY